jgi:tRNA1Val (adenine37-N6)-methyltransferase
MGNPYFQFKQFRIEQGRSAMKVCTDGCIFGAFVARNLDSSGIESPAILDVGAGTGLLSLMIAQRHSKAEIIGIEPDSGSFQDCMVNFSSSPWSQNLRVVNETIQSYSTSHPEKVDVLVCNPPFFVNHLKSPHQNRNSALHIEEAEWLEWMDHLFNLCSSETQIYLMLDPVTWQKTSDFISASGFFVVQQVDLIQTKGRFWRTIVCISRQSIPKRCDLVFEVYDKEGLLNSELKKWLSDYYL